MEIDFYKQPEQAIQLLAHEKIRLDIPEWEKKIWRFIAEWFNPEIKSVQIFTSGSTGKPKQVEHSKLAMMHSALLTCKALNLKHGNTALLCLPVTKIGGMMMVVRCICNKMKMTCLEPSSKPLSSLPTATDFDFAAFTPMQFHEITNHYTAFRNAGHLRKIILGGEDVRAELLAQIKRLDNEVYLTFGMTETISHIALKRLNGKLPDEHFKLLEDIRISNDANGCLVIEAPAIGQRRLATNDVVRLINKREFDWLGRADHVINSGGVKIHPEEVEQKLAPFIEAPFFISSIPDVVTGEKLVLVIEMKTLTADEKSELITAMGTLEKLQRPKEVLFTEHFVRTDNGKIKRKESLLKSSPITTI